MAEDKIWTPPCKKCALEKSEGQPPCPSLDESGASNSVPDVTIITTAKMLLRRFQPELVQYISIEALLPYLVQQHLLTDRETEVLLNEFLTHRERVMKLLHFIESKGPGGFQLFLKAIANEPDHEGHRCIMDLLAPYRYEIPHVPNQPPSLNSIADDIALQAALQPIQGSEFDLEETVIHFETSDFQPTTPQHLEPSITLAGPSTDNENVETELQAIRESIEYDSSDAASTSTHIVRKYPSLIYPTGPLKKKSHPFIYTSLFKMAWGGNESKAYSLMRHLRRSDQISVDMKVVSMEVVHTVNTDRDLKVLTSALAYTDRSTCENKIILKCRLHRRIAGLHYRNRDLEEASEHMETALQLAHQIGPDIDTIYTMRLKALMLFEEYKRTKDHKAYQDANKFFKRAMDHARRQPEWKRIITERVKVSKALFHLDVREDYQQWHKPDEALEELEYRAQETLDDVDEEYLTDGDKAFFHMTQAKLFVCTKDWQRAEVEAKEALDLNRKCGFDKRAKGNQELLEQIQAFKE